jgi:chromosomal replication initiation ATPase DnaA
MVATKQEMKTLAEYVEKHAKLFGFKMSEVKGKRRGWRIVQYRRFLAKILRGSGLSLPQIGSILNRHHTSVLHLIRTEDKWERGALN